MLKSVVLENKIDMVVVGPEEPLVNGVHDSFLKDPYLTHIAIIGPQAVAAQLEGSKDFAKKFMNRHKIPTAKHKTFSKDQINEARKFLESLNPPYVLKADGLAAGKGVLIIDTPLPAANPSAFKTYGGLRDSKNFVASFI